MKIILYIVLILAVLILAVSIMWQVWKKSPCPAWLSWFVELDNPFSKINRAATIIEYVKLQPGMVVLDAGCGPGRLTIPIAKEIGSQGKVVAMDIQTDMLDKVQKKAEQAGVQNIRFLHAGLGDNKLEPNTFDRALLVTVLGEIPNKEAALKEIFNALKPRGLFSITETIFDPHYQRFDAVLQRAQKVGFQKKEVFTDWFSFTLNLEKSQ